MTLPHRTLLRFHRNPCENEKTPPGRCASIDPYGKNDTEQGERVTKPTAPGTKMQRVIPADTEPYPMA